MKTKRYHTKRGIFIKKGYTEEQHISLKGTVFIKPENGVFIVKTLFTDGRDVAGNQLEM